MALIEITTTDAPPVEREDLFSIDGVVYTIPKDMPGTLALTLLDTARKQGESVAISWLLEEVLGENAYGALLACKTVTRTQMSAVVTVIREKVMGALEQMQGE